jgi:predicted Rdx family selenoprotein
MPTAASKARLQALLASLALGWGTTLILLSGLGCGAHAQDLEWAVRAGGTGDDIARSIATTPRGESYVTGSFSRTATFGPGEPNETTLTSARGSGLFVAKYARDGALVWARSAGGAGPPGPATSADGWAIATTASGESYVTGNFDRSVTFGPGEPKETTLTSAGSPAFVAKYARDGAFVWARSADSIELIQPFGIATTPGGESYVTGRFLQTATFGPGEPNETTLATTIPGGHFQVFVAKYARDGALLWARRAGCDSECVGVSIATTPRGESYVTGGFNGTATFGPGEPNETTLTAAGLAEPDIFVAKYARDGALLWARRDGGTETDGGSGIATTPRGESYVTGSFMGTATFGLGERNETTLTPGGGFVAKYARDGALVWARRDDGAGGGIATTSRGESFVTGGFRGTATFGLGERNETTLTPGGGFVAKYARDGALVWARRDDGAGGRIATTPRGVSYVTGLFNGTAIFGPGEPNETTLTSAGGQDVFVAKFNFRLPVKPHRS